MPRSSTSLTTSSLFMKRRRAFVACGNCRRRKIKKGLKCEYFGELGDEPSLEALTPSSGDQSSSHYQDKSCSPPLITPPSAGMTEYLNSSSRRARRAAVPQSKSGARCPSHSTPLSAAPPTAAPDCPWTLELTPQHFATNTYSVAMQQLASGAVAQYPHSATPSVGSPNMHSGSPYSQQQHPQYALQASGIEPRWLYVLDSRLSRLPTPHLLVYVFAHRDPVAAGRVKMHIEACGTCLILARSKG
ncbi:hypothetical protein C8R45DRAFT_927578 [Mycena sanguinolenta]|nr:hypothetical protein C8R45DRAFT_927578 [Mycena sanguinolenta]